MIYQTLMILLPNGVYLQVLKMVDFEKKKGRKKRSKRGRKSKSKNKSSKDLFSVL